MFVFSVDYTRTEYLQFEDDEYYYYVKAVPKAVVTIPEKTVKRINERQKTGVIDAEQVKELEEAARQQEESEIQKIIEEELPSAENLARIMATIGISRDLKTIGVDRQCAQFTFKATKDIRDKYVLSRLAWDLGILEELCNLL